MLSHSFTLVALVSLAEGGLPWWVNYPGFELWKFANLFLFILAALFLHRRFGRPVREALRSRSETIKRELHKAREERDAALAKLTEVEARFASLDAEVAAVKEKARVEAEAEKQRLTLSTEKDIAKIKEQATREIESAAKAAKQELRRFAAEESVRLAENILKREIKPEDDTRLANLNVEELGRVQA